MGGGGGGKSKSEKGKAHDYYGTIAGAVCVGPVDALVALICDGKTVWPTADDFKAGTYPAGALVRHRNRVWQATATTETEPGEEDAAWTTYAIARPNPVAGPYKLTVPGFGEAYFYWGTADQTLDALGEKVLAANGHPPYRGQAFIVLKDFLFGRERTSAPNVEVAVRRAPVQSVIEGPAAQLDEDGQANPLAAMAEILTHPVAGLGLPPELLEPDSWQTTADALHAQRAALYLSPRLEQANPVRNLVADLLPYFDGWLRWNTAGQIEAGRWAHNVSPPDFIAARRIDFNDLVEPVEYEAATHAETQNEVAVQFSDALRAWKDAQVRAVNTHHRSVVGEPRGSTVNRPWVSRRTQAAAIALEMLLILARPAVTGSLAVRAEKAALIVPGVLFLLSHPALGLSLVCRCTARTLDPPPAGSVRLEFENERALFGLARSPVFLVDDEPQAPRPARVEDFVFLQLPPEMADDTDHTLTLVAARANGVTSELRVWMRHADPEAWYELATLTTFALAGTVASGVNDLDEVTNLLTTDSTQGDTHDLAEADVWNVTVTVGLDVKVEGVDYALNAALGKLTILPGGSIANGSTVLASFSNSIEFALAPGTPPTDVERLLVVQGADAVADSALLLVVVRAGQPDEWELMAVKSVAAVGEDVYSVTVARQRFNTLAGGDGAHVWGAGDRVFVIERGSLVPMVHDAFPALAADEIAASFRLVPSSAWFTGDVADVYDVGTNPDGVTTETTHDFTDPYAPDANWLGIGSGGAKVGIWAIGTESRARAGNVATLVTSGPHGLATGNRVDVFGLGGTGYNADNVEVTVTDATTFSFPSAGPDETTTTDEGGTVQRLLDAAEATLLSAEFRDRNADLVDARVYAKRGTEEVSGDPASWTFAGVARQLVEVSLTLPEGDWRVFAALRDASGRTNRVELTPAGGGAPLPLRVRGVGTTTVANPLAEPIGGHYRTFPLLVTLSCSTAGAVLEFQWTGLGAAPGGVWSPYSGPVVIGAEGTLHARATKAGLMASPVLREDFW